MGFLNKLAAYSGKMSANYTTTVEALRKEVDSGTFKTDKLVESGLRLWFRNVDTWCDLFAALDADPTPVAFFDITKTNADVTVSIDIPAVDPKTLSPTAILPLGGASGKIAHTDVGLDYPSTGTLDIKLKNITASGLSAGMYQGYVLSQVAPSAQFKAIATIAVRVS